MNRNKLLLVGTGENKDPQTIVVSVNGIPNLALSHLFWKITFI